MRELIVLNVSDNPLASLPDLSGLEKLTNVTIDGFGEESSNSECDAEGHIGRGEGAVALVRNMVAKYFFVRWASCLGLDLERHPRGVSVRAF